MERHNWRPLQRKFRSAIKSLIENWVTGVHFRRFDWKPTGRATRGSTLKLNSSFESFWLPVMSSLPSILAISFDVYKMSVPYRLFFPDTTRLSRHFQKWERFLPRNFERSSRKFSTLIHSGQALSNHIAARFLRKRNSLRGTVRNISKFKDRANWSRDTFQPMRRRACVYQQTNQNIAPVIKNFQNSGRSRTKLKMSLQYSSRFHTYSKKTFHVRE